MALSDSKRKECSKRILTSRLRVLLENGFYGLLLMHMKFAIDEECETAATDGEKIIFGPSFLDEITDKELDFVMIHEVLHVALRHCARTEDRDNELFNIACDIVVNSNILFSNNMDEDSITLEKYGVSMHKTPEDEEGYLFTAEEVYSMLEKNKQISIPVASLRGPGKSKQNKSSSQHWDDHDKWGSTDKRKDDLWKERIINAVRSVEIRDLSHMCGNMPLFASRMIKELREAQTDWRSVLNDFVQEVITDYSFTPPDRRFDDSPFFLPDFNEKDTVIKDVLFMIDTSGSMSDEMITAAYSEVLGAIRQFGGKLNGWLGFFDAVVIDPKEFTDESEFEIIRPQGGGGTSFRAIFKYIDSEMYDKDLSSIVILTDGYAEFPEEREANGIPVLWIINNTEVDPPWGKVARIR